MTMAYRDTEVLCHHVQGLHIGVPDFSCLPEVVWVRVLQLLDGTDRYHASLTCSRLDALFDHPSVWSHALLEFSVSDDGEMAHYGDWSVLQHKHSVLRYVRVDVQKHYHSPSQVLSPEEISTVLDLPLSSNLNSLSVDVQLDISCFKSVFENSQAAHLSSVLDELCDRAPEKLHVRLTLTDAASAFHTDSSACRVFDGLRRRTWLRALASFSFPHGSLSEERQYSLYPDLSSTPTAVLVSRFLSLRCLQLNAVNLSDHLLLQLAHASRSRCPLRSLVIHFKDCCDKAPAAEASAEVPVLSSSAWRELVSACPQLQVSCLIGAALSEQDLTSVVKPEAPVTSVDCLSKVDKGVEEWVPFCVQHSGTLRRFTYNQHLKTVIRLRCERRADRGASLVAMVTECPGLRHLAYVGEVHHEDVARLAELDRHWTSFVFLEKLVLLEDRDRPYRPGCRANLPPAVILAQKQTLDRMREHVSRCLGYPWRPRNS